MNEKNVVLQKLHKLNQLHSEILSEALLLDMESVLMQYLKNHPKDTDMWLKLTMVEFTPPLEDYERIEKYILTILVYDKENIQGLLVLAYAQCVYRGRVSEDIFTHLKNICTTITDKKILSMIYLAMAWYYEFIDKNLYEQALLKSIHCCDEYVKNYVSLGRLYFNEGKNAEGKKMIQYALKNIQKIYQKDYFFIDVTDINSFFNEYFKGIDISKPNLESIQELIL